MKKHFLMLVALLMAVVIAAPAFAAVEFKYGGMFRARIISQQNFDGTDEFDDHLNRLDQRFRLYFTFKASENLQLVTKFEGNAVWGDPDTYGRVGADWGGNGPSGESNLVVKNAYLDFAIPNTPTRALVGVQTITLLDSWVIDEDLSAAVLKTKLDPVVVTVGYVAGQNDNWESPPAGAYSSEWDNVDAWFLNLDYKGGPLSASLIGYYQDGHDTVASLDPTTTTNNPQTATNVQRVTLGNRFDVFTKPYLDFTGPDGQGNVDYFTVRDNQLFDVGMKVAYKLDWMSAYITFVKNFGSADVAYTEGNTHKNAAGKLVTDVVDRDNYESWDYTGWMIDAGFNYFCGPWAFNIGGFYTTGQDWKDIYKDIMNDTEGYHKQDFDFFTYPLGTTKYFSEIMGGGILDNTAPVHRIAHNDEFVSQEKYQGAKDYQWTAYGNPSNLWTVTIGGSYQVLEQTKISASYWYFGSSEDVVSGLKFVDGEQVGYKFANDIGHEIDLNVTQGIVDGLTLDLVGAYMFAGDAFSGNNNDDDVYELGARLQWSF